MAKRKQAQQQKPTARILFHQRRTVVQRADGSIRIRDAERSIGGGSDVYITFTAAEWRVITTAAVREAQEVRRHGPA